jgi:hypothetical protein
MYIYLTNAAILIASNKLNIKTKCTRVFRTLPTGNYGVCQGDLDIRPPTSPEVGEMDF